MMIAGSCHCYELLEQVPVMLSDVLNCNICIATLANTFGCFVHSVYEPPYYYNVSQLQWDTFNVDLQFLF